MRRNMTRLKRKPLSYVFITVMVTLFLRTGVAQALSPTSGTWNIVPSPNIGSAQNDLEGVADIASNDVWAVGIYENHNVGPFYTLTEHWNGSQWSVIQSPNVQSVNNELRGVAAVTSNDVWAVGETSSSNGQGQTLIEHWDGSKWSIVSSPSTGIDDVLTGVTVISANDIWAVGSYYTNQAQLLTLILHWDGSQWSIVPSPNNGSYFNLLNGVTAISASDIWAAGFYDQRPNSKDQTLLEHWDGSQWSIVPGANHGSNYNDLNGVTAVSSTQVWAVGYYYQCDSCGAVQTLIERWNGKKWQIVSSPNAGSNDFLHGVTAVSGNDIWAAGFYVNSSGLDQTLIEQWNGSLWSVIPSPNSPSGHNDLFAIAASSASDIWSVGYFLPKTATNTQFSLTEHCSC